MVKYVNPTRDQLSDDEKDALMAIHPINKPDVMAMAEMLFIDMMKGDDLDTVEEKYAAAEDCVTNAAIFANVAGIRVHELLVKEEK